RRVDDSARHDPITLTAARSQVSALLQPLAIPNDWPRELRLVERDSEHVRRLLLQIGKVLSRRNQPSEQCVSALDLLRLARHAAQRLVCLISAARHPDGTNLSDR